MKSVVALAVFIVSLSAMEQTTMSTQQVSLPLLVPCVNHGKGEIVNLSGCVRVLTGRFSINGLAGC